MKPLSSNNNNIISRSRLSSPGEIREQLPLSEEAVREVISDREQICEILDGRSKRFLFIVGPCSIHNVEQALEYARKLKALSREVSDRILLVMRVYFDKPRTTIGWKGMINDPDLNHTYNIEKGVYTARSLILKIVELGLPTATEMLDPISAQYIADAVSYAAIGARTTEAQTHRELGSGLSMPVGFKNATDGSLQTAIDAIATARSRHCFIGVMEDGHVGVFKTKGNPYSHIILRGGPQPNYGPEYVAFLKVAMKKAKLPSAIVVDCSHANSKKDYRKQGAVLENVLAQITEGEHDIAGVMMESNLLSGSQKLIEGKPLEYGVSITDGCLGFDETAELIRATYRKLGGIAEK